MGLARDIALIFLGLEALAMGIVPLIVLAGLAYGVYSLRELTRIVLRRLQEAAVKLAHGVEDSSRAIARPFIALQSAWCGATSMIHFLTRRKIN